MFVCCEVHYAEHLSCQGLATFIIWASSSSYVLLRTDESSRSMHRCPGKDESVQHCTGCLVAILQAHLRKSQFKQQLDGHFTTCLVQKYGNSKRILFSLFPPRLMTSEVGQVYCNSPVLWLRTRNGKLSNMLSTQQERPWTFFLIDLQRIWASTVQWAHLLSSDFKGAALHSLVRMHQSTQKTNLRHRSGGEYRVLLNTQCF